MINKTLCTLILCSLLLSCTSLGAPNSSAKFYGTWQLVSITQESDAGKKQLDTYGKNPSGYLMYSPDGHMITIVVKDQRQKPINSQMTPAEALRLMNSMTSYAGTYTILQDKVIHHVEVSWNQTWTGSDQIRQYAFRDQYLFLSMPPYTDKNGKKTTITLQWKKVSASKQN